MEQNDAQIIEGCLRKDERAYRALYERYAPRLYGLCMRYTRTSAAAEDVLHDGFIKVFENLHRLRDVKLLEPWMRRIMVFTAVNAQRHELPVANFSEANYECVDENVSVDSVVASVDVSLLLDAMRRMPPSFRTVLNLCEVEGYTCEEAAKQMGIKPSSARSALVRARKMLVNMLLDRQQMPEKEPNNESPAAQSGECET